MPAGREYELKFEIDPGHVERLVADPSIGLPTRRRRIVSTYFDTEAATLRRRGVSLRVRRSDVALVETVKRSGSSLVDRQEWEHESAGPTPDLDWLRSTPLKALFRSSRVGAGLQPRFSVDVDRSTFAVRYGGAEIEGALDRGAIQAGGHSLSVCEFELELKRGRAGSVLKLARALSKDVPLVLSLASKAERGYGLLDRTWGQPTKDYVLELRRRTSCAEAFERIAQACLRLFLVNAALIGGGDDAEAVHKARIALRRLRAGLDLFKPVMRRRYRGVLKEVKWPSGELGRARDADVFQEQLVGTLAGSGTGKNVCVLADVATEQRRCDHRALDEALRSRRCRLLLLDLVELSQKGVRRAERRAPFLPFLRGRLAKRRRALVRRAKHLRSCSPDDRHEVRKQAKMLHYGLDVVARQPKLVKRPKRLGRLLDHLDGLQKTLGILQDAQAFRSRLQSIGAGAHDEAARAAASLRAKPRRAKKELKKACKAARGVRAATAILLRD